MQTCKHIVIQKVARFSKIVYSCYIRKGFFMGQKLTRIISLRIKEKEYEILQKLSKQSEQSFSEFLRRRIYEVINKKII